MHTASLFTDQMFSMQNSLNLKIPGSMHPPLGGHAASSQEGPGIIGSKYHGSTAELCALHLLDSITDEEDRSYPPEKLQRFPFQLEDLSRRSSGKEGIVDETDYCFVDLEDDNTSVDSGESQLLASPELAPSSTVPRAQPAGENSAQCPKDDQPLSSMWDDDFLHAFNSMALQQTAQKKDVALCNPVQHLSLPWPQLSDDGPFHDQGYSSPRQQISEMAADGLMQAQTQIKRVVSHPVFPSFALHPGACHTLPKNDSSMPRTCSTASLHRQVLPPPPAGHRYALATVLVPVSDGVTPAAPAPPPAGFYQPGPPATAASLPRRGPGAGFPRASSTAHLSRSASMLNFGQPPPPPPPGTRLAHGGALKYHPGAAGAAPPPPPPRAVPLPPSPGQVSGGSTAPGSPQSGSGGKAFDVGDGYLYQVRFKRSIRGFLLAEGLAKAPAGSAPAVRVGDYVKVEGDRGEDLGKVVARLPLALPPAAPAGDGGTGAGAGAVAEGERERAAARLGLYERERIVRPAAEGEVAHVRAKAVDEARALEVARLKARQRALPMRLLDAEFQFDRRKLTFFFRAAGRVDFRELVRDLFALYKTRIWMQQVDHAAPALPPAPAVGQAAASVSASATSAAAPELPPPAQSSVGGDKEGQNFLVGLPSPPSAPQATSSRR